MQNALNDANINSEKVDYINAHGTSTPSGDKVEVNLKVSGKASLGKCCVPKLLNIHVCVLSTRT